MELDLRWTRCFDGYRLEKPKPLSAKMSAKLKKGRWVDVNPFPNSDWICPNSGKLERYSPLKNVLFKIFAEWEATPEGMVRFCNSYGPLAQVNGGIEQVDWLLAEQRTMATALMLINSGNPAELIKRLNTARTGGCQLMLWRTEYGSLKTVLVPSSLIQAMWLQLALYAASPDTRLLSCQRCGKPFYVGAGTKRRSSAKYCSNACKVAAYKARQEA